MESGRKTIFEQILAGELPAKRVYENDVLFVIHDKYPKAPVHLLIIPKKVIRDLQSMEEADFPLLGEVVKVAQKLVVDFGLNGYRLVVNNGVHAGQTIFHLHFHLLGGHLLGAMG